MAAQILPTQIPTQILPKGLSVTLDVITQKEEQEIIDYLDSKIWVHVNPSNPKSRRVQQFGYGYAYTSKKLIPGDPIDGPIGILAERIKLGGLMDPVQCIVNEYLQTQGIAAHIDNKNFGGAVVGISICDDGVLTFRKDKEVIEVFLPRRSMMVMSGESRYIWTHEMKSTKSYFVDSLKVVKPTTYRRISLTFRELAK